MSINKIILALSTMSFSACVSLQSVSLTQIPEKRSKKVKAEASKTTFLAFNFDNDFVNQLTDSLKDKCPDGKVQGILTKDQLTSYFIVSTRSVIATGYCN